jgi:3-dehydroquinate synthase
MTYSRLAGHLSSRDCERCLACLESLGFALVHPAMQDPALLSGLEEFREHLGGELTITLLKSIGQGFDAHEMDPNLIAQAIHELFERTHSRHMAQARLAPQRKEIA